MCAAGRPSYTRNVWLKFAVAASEKAKIGTTNMNTNGPVIKICSTYDWMLCCLKKKKSKTEDVFYVQSPKSVQRGKGAETLSFSVEDGEDDPHNEKLVETRC